MDDSETESVVLFLNTARESTQIVTVQENNSIQIINNWVRKKAKTPLPVDGWGADWLEVTLLASCVFLRPS